MIIFLDESGDLGWTLDKPRKHGGSSRFITIAGIIFENNNLKDLSRCIHELCTKNFARPNVETKGSIIPPSLATSILKDLQMFAKDLPFEIISLTADKRNVPERLYRDKSIFYNYMLNTLLSDYLHQYDDIEVILDDRTIKKGSRNSFEDCLRAKCWGELGLNTNISCRFEESHKNPGIWLADWLANFIWRRYENNIQEPYNACNAYGHRFHERRLFI